MIRITLIRNGTRKVPSSVRQLIDRIDQLDNVELTELSTDREGHAKELAEAHALTSEILIAAGGDGTANEVLNGIMVTGAKCSFGIIPIGTGNDFLRSIDDFDPERFIKTIESGTARKVDVGVINYMDGKSYFLNIADIGFGAAVIEKMNKQRRSGLKGSTSYSLAILRTFFTFHKKRVKLDIDGKIYDQKALMIAFCNGSTFGDGLVIHPGAMIDSGKIEVTIIGDVSLVEYVRNLKRLKKGEKLDHPEVTYLTASSINFDDLSNFQIEADGELFDAGFRSISILPSQINLIN